MFQTVRRLVRQAPSIETPQKSTVGRIGLFARRASSVSSSAKSASTPPSREFSGEILKIELRCRHRLQHLRHGRAHRSLSGSFSGTSQVQQSLQQPHQP